MPTDSLDIGPVADRPAPSAYNRDKFWFDDATGILSVSNGTMWTDIGGGGGSGAEDVLNFTNTGAMPPLGDYDFVSTAGENTIPQVLFGLSDDEAAYVQVAPEIVQPFGVWSNETLQAVPPNVMTQLTFDNVIQEHILSQNPAGSGNFNIPSQSDPQIIGGLYMMNVHLTLQASGPSSLTEIEMDVRYNVNNLLDIVTKTISDPNPTSGLFDISHTMIFPNLVLPGDITVLVKHDDAQDLWTVGEGNGLRTSVQIARLTQTARISV